MARRVSRSQQLQHPTAPAAMDIGVIIDSGDGGRDHERLAFVDKPHMTYRCLIENGMDG